MANIYVSVGTSFSATISTTYPAGSTCTVSNYKKTWTAPNTSGSWTFKANEVGYYTVEATKGSQSTSQTVAITTQGQVVDVVLGFDYVIFSNETGLNSAYTDGGGGATVNVVTISSGEKVLIFPNGGGDNRMAYIKPAVDLTNYKTLKISGAAGANRWFGVWNQVPNSSDIGVVAKVIMGPSDTPVLYTIDVSNLSGSYYLGTQYAVETTYVYDLRLAA